MNFIQLKKALLLSAISAANTVIANPAPTSSEYGYWSFDGGNHQLGAADFSAAQHHGYFLGIGEGDKSGGEFVNGKKGTALVVEQDNPLIIPAADLDITQPFSIAFWFNIEQWAVTQTFVEKRSSKHKAEFSIYLDDKNQLNVIFSDAAGKKGSLVSLPLENTAQWQHVVFSYGGSAKTMHLSLNGQSANTVNLGLPNLSPIDGPLIIGNSELNGLETPVIGQLDELRIFTRAISSIEAKCIAENGFNCVPVFYQGPQGVKGDQGAPGLKGDKGNQGDKGDRGLQGEKGEQGNQGLIGPRGSQGLKGEKGDKGNQGPIGETGPQGPKGDQGIQGEKGDKGDPGSSVDRKHYYTTKAERGTSIVIPEQDVIDLCSDEDGCQLRLGLDDWNTGLPGDVEFGSYMFFYNKDTKSWFGNKGSERYGKNGDGVIRDIAPTYSCIFSDGSYKNWNAGVDSTLDFSLVSWKQYNANCRLTIID